MITHHLLGGGNTMNRQTARCDQTRNSLKRRTFQQLSKFTRSQVKVPVGVEALYKLTNSPYSPKPPTWTTLVALVDTG